MVLRSVLATVASLGAVHALAGATQFVVSKSSPVTGTVGTAMSYGFAVTGAPTIAGSYRVTGQLPPGLSLVGGNANGIVNGSTGTISGTPTTPGSYSVAIRAYEFNNGTGDAFGPLNVVFSIAGAATSAPAIAAQPTDQWGDVGGTVVLSVAATGSPPPTYQWRRNGNVIAGAIGAALTLSNLQPADAGVYTATLSNSGGSVVTQNAIVGVRTTSKAIGGTVVGTDIPHPNGNRFDQVLMSSAAETITAEPGRVTRTSFIDLSDNIVQVEFSGAGTVSIVLDGMTGPGAPVNYNQPTVAYVKGHASIVVAGADETTNLSVFTVGHATAFDPTGAYNILLLPGGANDPALNGSSLFAGHPLSSFADKGVADIAFIAISSTNGKFGGLRTANANYWATAGIAGVYAPGVTFSAAVNVGDIAAFDTATPMLLLGGTAVTPLITGGDLLQANGRAVQISGFTQIRFVDGSRSSGSILPAQTNQGHFEKNGAEVTGEVVVP